MSDNELNRMDDETPLGIQETDEDVPLGSDCLEKAKRQTFSHWPHANPSGERMAEAGFFNCNAGDRTICLECNLICHKWTPNVDNPSEVHKALSPNCAFVRAKLVRRDPPRTINVGLSSTVNPDNNSNDVAQQPLWLMCDEIAPKMSIHHQYSELPQRHDSFAQWPAGNLPSVDDLVQAGFFYTGTRTIVTCFFCNGSLQNWGPKDSPMADHARWFPHCAYARQLCGEDLFRAIQESVRVQLGEFHYWYVVRFLCHALIFRTIQSQQLEWTGSLEYLTERDELPKQSSPTTDSWRDYARAIGRCSTGLADFQKHVRVRFDII